MLSLGLISLLCVFISITAEKSIDLQMQAVYGQIRSH